MRKAKVLEEILGRDPLLKPNAVLQVPSGGPNEAQEANEAIRLEPEDPSQRMASSIAKNMERWFAHPWTMIDDGVVFTLDSADMLNPVKQFPSEPWLQQVCEEWLGNKLVAVCKSRRMKISWLMVFLHLHLAMFREGAAVFFVSDKEEKSDELVKRAEFMYNHIPEDSMLKPKAKGKYRYLEFPGLDSYIMGVAQGSDQLRQYTASAILADEIAYWEKGRETFMAMKPTIEGGGRITCVSTANEGFFYELCWDMLR